MKVSPTVARKCLSRASAVAGVILPLPPKPSEAVFQAHVFKLAEDHGWLVFHDYDSRRNAAGFPDLTLVRGGVLIFAELKADKGRMRSAQRTWLAELGAVSGPLVRVWRPVDWPEIVATLTSRRTA